MLLGNEIDDSEDDDPYDVNKVPVQANYLNSFGAFDTYLSSRDKHPHRREHDNAQRHVDAMKAGECVER